MARAIIRYSCDTEPAGKYQAEKARKAIRDVLEEAGFTRVGAAQRGTAAWEFSSNAPNAAATVAKTMQDVFSAVSAFPPGVLDHIWVYCDD